MIAGQNGSAPSGINLSGAVIVRQRGLVSRILFYAVIPLGAALPRTLISDLPGGFGACVESCLAASGRCGARLRLSCRAFLPIWSCSVWGLPCLRRYRRSGALLPHLFTLTGLAVQATALRARPCCSEEPRLTEAVAVCFLWHWPSTGLHARVPDVIRHTTLRSSDFPPPAAACAAPAATARSSCQCLVYRESASKRCNCFVRASNVHS